MLLIKAMPAGLREVIPFFLALVAVLILVSLVPQTVLFLPNLIIGNQPGLFTSRGCRR